MSTDILMMLATFAWLSLPITAVVVAVIVDL